MAVQSTYNKGETLYSKVKQDRKHYKTRQQREVLSFAANSRNYRSISGTIDHIMSLNHSPFLNSILYLMKSFSDPLYAFKSSRYTSLKLIVKYLESAARLGHFSRLYLDLSDMYIKLGDYEKSIECLEKLRKALPSIESESLFQEAFQISHSLIEKQKIDLIDQHISLGRYDEAIATINQLKQSHAFLENDRDLDGLILFCNKEKEVKARILEELLLEGSSSVDSKKKKPKKKHKKKNTTATLAPAKDISVLPSDKSAPVLQGAVKTKRWYKKQ